jgi:GNAT superfamily N-acetyltransferase
MTEQLKTRAEMYEVLEKLRDGRTIIIRAIRPDDRQRLSAHFKALSPQSVYFRFFGLKRDLTETNLDRFTRPDFASHIGLAAVVNEEGCERFIGVGRYIAKPNLDKESNSAEVAFAVLDADQGHGIGTLLLEHLAQVARERGINRFTADAMAGNAKMLDVFEKSGFEVHESSEPGLIHVIFPIGAPRDSWKPINIAHAKPTQWMEDELCNTARVRKIGWEISCTMSKLLVRTSGHVSTMRSF